MGSSHHFRNDKGPPGTIPTITRIVNFAFEIPYFAKQLTQLWKRRLAYEFEFI